MDFASRWARKYGKPDCRPAPAEEAILEFLVQTPPPAVILPANGGVAAEMALPPGVIYPVNRIWENGRPAQRRPPSATSWQEAKRPERQPRSTAIAG
jgi:hypothetical protein